MALDTQSIQRLHRPSLPPLMSSGYNTTTTFDGIVNYDGSDSYTLIGRNGVCETVGYPIHRDQLLIQYVEAKVFAWVSQTVRGLRELDLNTQYSVALSLFGVKNVQPALPPGYFRHEAHPTRQDVLFFQEVAIEPSALDSESVATSLKASFDHLSQTVGLESSLSYDSQGVWKPTA